MNSFRATWLCWCVVAALAGCQNPAAETSNGGNSMQGGKLETVTLGLNWYPETEHGGFYAAVVHGYFEEEGLKVDIMRGGPESPIVQQVAGGERMFGVTNADNIVFGRSQQAPVVAIMAPLQFSPRCLIVHEESGIKGFDDLRNMTVAMSNSQAFFHYLRHRVPLEGVQVVPYAGSVARFLEEPDFAQQGYVFSEPYIARQQGGDPKVLMLSDLGFNPYTSLLFTSESVLAQRPELLRKMVAASKRGWEKYLESPEETNQLIHKLNPEMDLDMLAYGAQTMKPLVLDAVAEEKGIGHMSLDRWRTLVEQIVECGQLKAGEVDPASCFVATFLAPR